MPQPILTNETATEMQVEVQNSDETPQNFLTNERCRIWVEVLESHLTAHMKDRVFNGDVCIRTVGLEESQALNTSYRGKEKPTNVLSFPAEVLGDANVLGDLAICWPLVEDEAHDQGKRIEDHALHLVIHGLLHLLGYDHETDTDGDEMEGLEVQVLADLGVANPYV